LSPCDTCWLHTLAAGSNPSDFNPFLAYAMLPTHACKVPKFQAALALHSHGHPTWALHGHHRHPALQLVAALIVICICASIINPHALGDAGRALLWGGNGAGSGQDWQASIPATAVRWPPAAHHAATAMMWNSKRCLSEIIHP